MASRVEVIEDILDNPGSSFLYMNHRYYYAIGNTKSVDLTEGCEVPAHAQFLLLGCGDIRNVLKTVHELNHLKHGPESLNFHLNDIDDVMLARSAALLQIVSTLDADKADDVQFLWNVWYNLKLSEHNFQRLKSILSDILENPLDCLKFGTQETATSVKRVIKYWLKLSMRVRDAQQKRESFMRKKAAADLQKKERDIKLTEMVDALLCNCSGFLIGCLYRSKQVEYFEEIKTYYRTGSTDESADPGFTNPTLLCPHVAGWRVHPFALPYSAFNELMFDEKLSLKQNCIMQLTSQLRSWKTYTRNGGTINISLWDGDAFVLCNKQMPGDKKFHFINTSNLADHTSLLNILLTCSKLLERSGVLTVQTMRLFDEAHGCMEKYLEVKIGIPASFYPTFLGLNLAEDFELGTSEIPQHRLSSGLNEVSTRWVSAGHSLCRISIEESPEIVQIFERLAKSCFNMMDPKNPNLLNTPLTLVYLMKQLSTKLEGGITPLLEFAEKCLPRKVTRYGEKFCPLDMEWRVLTQYHFRDVLPGKLNELLVEVRVPVQPRQLKLTIGKNIPAGQGINHRCLVASHCLEVLAITQGQNPNPWNVMTLMDYDYKTNMMTCVVPKSDAMVFHPDVFFVPVLPGCLSHMAPTYRWTAFVLAGVDVSRSNTHSKLQIEDQDQMGVKLTLGETKLDYKIAIRPRVPSITIKSLEVGAKDTTITAKCEIKKNEKEPEAVVIKAEFPCQMALSTPKLYNKDRTIKLPKSRSKVQGQLILPPSRRIDISSYPRLSAKHIQHFEFIVMYMFSPSAEDRERKEQGIESTEALYQLKETLQILLNWTLVPPKEKPFVRAYRILKKQRKNGEGSGYFPEDIFLAVRNLHSLNGMPTLDVMWIDFEVYRDMHTEETLMKYRLMQHFILVFTTCEGTLYEPRHEISNNVVLYEDDVNSDKAEKHIHKHEIGIPEREDTIHTFMVSVQVISRWQQSRLARKECRHILKEYATEDGGHQHCVKEANLLKKLLRINSSRSEQKLQNTSSLPWAFNSFLQPVFSIKPEFDKIKAESGAAAGGSSKARLFGSSLWLYIILPLFNWLWSHFVASEKSSRQVLSEVSQNTVTGKCGFCGRSKPDMKKCARCKLVVYCNKNCQQKDWKARHKKRCQTHQPEA